MYCVTYALIYWVRYVLCDICIDILSRRVGSHMYLYVCIYTRYLFGYVCVNIKQARGLSVRLPTTSAETCDSPSSSSSSAWLHSQNTLHHVQHHAQEEDDWRAIRRCAGTRVLRCLKYFYASKASRFGGTRVLRCLRAGTYQIVCSEYTDTE